jgi:LPXTG-motif cell wall-anchored protein
MSIRRLLAGAALGAVASVVSAVPASAAPSYPPVTGGLTVSATNVVAGSAITATGEGFAPNSKVMVTVVMQGMGVVRSFSVTADASGKVSAVVRLSVAGTATITFSGADPDGVPLVLSSTVLVAAAPPPASAGGLPNTGANVLSPLIVGGVLVLGGVGAIFATRRRRRRGSAPSTG